MKRLGAYAFVVAVIALAALCLTACGPTEPGTHAECTKTRAMFVLSPMSNGRSLLLLPRQVVLCTEWRLLPDSATKDPAPQTPVRFDTTGR